MRSVIRTTLGSRAAVNVARASPLVYRLPAAAVHSSAWSQKVYDGQGTIPAIPKWAVSITDFLLGDVTSKYQEPATIEAETGETTTFARLKERTDWMAIQYYIRGWEQGEMLAVFMPNSPIFTITCLGAAKIGVPFTIVDPASSPFELQHQLKDSRAIYIITTKQLLPVVRQVTPAMRGLKEILVLDKEDDPTEKKEIRFSIEMKYNLLFGKPPGWGALPDWTVKPSDTALIHYGPAAIKGGKPKGLVVSHGMLINSVLQAEAIFGSLTKDDVLLSTVPYFNLDAFSLINNLAIHKGIKSVTIASPSVAAFVDAVQKNNVTVARVSSAFLTELSAAPKAELATLKRVILDSGSVDLSSLKKNYPKITFETSYAAPTLVSLNEKLLPATQVKLVNDEGKDVDAKEGLLAVKGEQIPAQYFNSEDATAARFDKDGFFNTKDKAKIAADGKVSVTPRPPTDE